MPKIEVPAVPLDLAKDRDTLDDPHHQRKLSDGDFLAESHDEESPE
jgi:hypothetical protein